MEVLLRSSAVSLMVVGADASDAIGSALQLPEFADSRIEATTAKPMGGPETFSMIVDFVRETGTLIPGFDSSMLEQPRENLIGFEAWMVTVEYVVRVRWEPVKKPAAAAPPPNEIPSGGGLADQVGGEPLG